MRNNNLLAVSEIFGPTFQGEGKNIGLPVMFLRMAGCNQHCIWCDTPYTWRFTDKYPHEWNEVFDPKVEVVSMTIEAVEDVLSEHRSIGNLVVSGGEPMLQQAGLIRLFRDLKAGGWRHIEIETAGTIAPVQSDDVDLYTVSIKLAHSNNPTSLRINRQAIDAFMRSGKAVWKFVAGSAKDFDEIDDLVKTHHLDPVYIMPEGIKGDDIKATAQQIARATIERNYNLTTRMQILLYGNKRGI